MMESTMAGYSVQMKVDSTVVVMVELLAENLVVSMVDSTVVHWVGLMAGL